MLFSKANLEHMWVLDIEANSLLRDVTEIHCATFVNAKTGAIKVYSTGAEGGTIIESLTFLKEILKSPKGIVVGHNMAGYDLTVYGKLYDIDMTEYYHKVIDTILVCALFFPKHILEKHKLNKHLHFVPHLAGSQSLKNWGIRLLGPGDGKMEIETDWKEYTPEMLEYNIQDVKVNLTLLYYLLDHQEKSKHTLEDNLLYIENFASLLASSMTVTGWQIDEVLLTKTAVNLESEIAKIDLGLAGRFPSYTKPTDEFAHSNLLRLSDHLTAADFPLHLLGDVEVSEQVLFNLGEKVGLLNPEAFSKNLKSLMYSTRKASRWEDISPDTPNSVLKEFSSPVAYTKAGKPKTKKNPAFRYNEESGTFQRKVLIQFYPLQTPLTTKVFKPNSRASIVDFMYRKYGWKSEILTDSFNLKLEAETFERLEYAEAPALTQRFKLAKMLSQCETIRGHLKNGRVHSNTNTLGTNTYRTTSTSPNVAQIDKKGTFRQMFTADKGWVMMGGDLGGARLLAHRLEIA